MVRKKITTTPAGTRTTPDSTSRTARSRSTAAPAGAARSGRPAKAKITIPTEGSLPVEEDEVLIKEEPDEQGLVQASEDWTEFAMEDPVEILEDPAIALELSEDPVRLYLKEIGQIHLLDADSEFRLAARIEAERRPARYRHGALRHLSAAGDYQTPCHPALAGRRRPPQ